VRALAAAAAASLVLAACGSDGDGGSGEGGGSDSGGEGLTEITVAFPAPSAIFFFPMAVAMSEGYMEEEGIEITWETVDGVPSVLQAMASGQADMGTVDPANLMIARSQDQALQGFFYYMPGGIYSFMVPAESDIEEPADLQGMTIGVGTAEGGEVSFARSILAEAGLEEGTNYEFLTVGDGGSAVAGFARGDIDAYAGSLVDASVMEAGGTDIRDITPDDLQVPPTGGFYTMSEEFIQENPEMIESMGRALARATDLAVSDPQVVLRAAKEINPEEVADESLSTALAELVTEQTFPLGDPERWGFVPEDYLTAWHGQYLETEVLESSLEDPTAAFFGDLVDDYNDLGN
jgi:NitT/TauT family transport system substrate-binding protein